MPSYTYRAVRIRQTHADNSLVLFGATATEIDLWAGVPQKKVLGENEETTGFQREVNEGRLESLKRFYSDERNLIPNPLLCATRQSSQGTVEFTPDGDGSVQLDIESGHVTIEVEALEELSLATILRRVKDDLESRVPGLQGRAVPVERIKELKLQAKIGLDDNPDEDDEDNGALADSDIEESESDSEDVGSVMFDESHLFDFWEQVSARSVILSELGDAFTSDTFLGYPRDAMAALLRPVVLVDGQHRLRGAVEAAKALAGQEPQRSEIEDRIVAGESDSAVQRDVEGRVARILPVSLLLSPDPAEHVFQFVVVNQTAVRITRALLGTIVSTSLSNDELQRVSERLTKSGIPLEESRAVAYFTRHRESPFYNLVEKGLSSDSKDLLAWNVLVSLVTIFRDLKGGKLFHERIDYADKWRRLCLHKAGIVAEKGDASAYEFWKCSDGPWREVFMAFWWAVRAELGSNAEGDWHFWGSPRTSNLFNKVSLTLLASDFFQYLTDTERGIDGADQIPSLVKSWLGDVNRNYFNKDWRLEGVKKDSTGIRKRWSKEWVQYRKDPQRLPDVRVYRQPAGID